MQNKNRLILISILLTAGIALTLTGIFLGDPMTIFQKAVFVCLECMGLG